MTPPPFGYQKNKQDTDIRTHEHTDSLARDATHVIGNGPVELGPARLTRVHENRIEARALRQARQAARAIRGHLLFGVPLFLLRCSGTSPVLASLIAAPDAGNMYPFC